jgi:hypothetical protein
VSLFLVVPKGETLPVVLFNYMKFDLDGAIAAASMVSILLALSVVLVLERLIGPKSIGEIDQTDIAHLLGDANGRSTRKRRLTSVRRHATQETGKRQHRYDLVALAPACVSSRDGIRNIGRRAAFNRDLLQFPFREEAHPLTVG